jgi:hypothetical protein
MHHRTDPAHRGFDPGQGAIVESASSQQPQRTAWPSKGGPDVRAGDPGTGGRRRQGPSRARPVGPGARPRVDWLAGHNCRGDRGRPLHRAGPLHLRGGSPAQQRPPEQDRWWAETAKLFTGEASFKDSSDVTVDVTGDPDEAGFVQVIQGRGSDPDRARELMGQDSSAWAAFRPEILGSVAVGHEGGAYTMAVYFTSEAEAREGERKQPPPELQAQMDEMAALGVGQPEFFDLKQPWLYSPR